MRLFSELQAGTVAGIHAYSIYMCISHHVRFSTYLAISLKIKREYAGVLIPWITRKKKEHLMQQHKFTLSTASLIEMIGTACSHWSTDHSSTTRLYSKAAKQGCVTSSRIGGRNEPKKNKKAAHGTQSCCRPWRPCIFLGEKELAAARSFKVLAESRCVKNRSVWLPLPAASLPLDQMQYAYLYLQG